MRTNLSSQFTPQQRVALRPKVVCRNTFRYFERDAEVIRLHRTDIVRKHGNGKVELNSGGWKTVTTKDRMNSYSGYRIYSLKGLWHVSDGNGQSVPFFDGMILPDAFSSKKGEKAKHDAKLSAAILKFVNKIGPRDKLPLPDTSDCWLCCMYNTDGKTMGEIGGDDKDHLLSHIREGYLHGSLLMNAMRWAGYQDHGIAVHLNSNFNGHRSVKSALRRYLRRKLGIG